MAKTLEDERAALAAEEAKLEERRRDLAEREKAQAIALIEKAGFLKVVPSRFAALVDRMKKLGFDEVEKRLGA